MPLKNPTNPDGEKGTLQNLNIFTFLHIYLSCITFNKPLSKFPKCGTFNKPYSAFTRSEIMEKFKLPCLKLQKIGTHFLTEYGPFRDPLFNPVQWTIKNPLMGEKGIHCTETLDSKISSSCNF